jgi:hypothetical protein
MNGFDQDTPPSSERLAAMPIDTLNGWRLNRFAWAPLKYATRPSELNATPGSLAASALPPVQADSPGTKIREKLRPPSSEAITRSVAAPSWIQATRIRRGSRGSTATEVSTERPRVKFGSARVHGPENGLVSEIRRGRSIRTVAAHAGSVTAVATTKPSAANTPARPATRQPPTTVG